MKLRYTSACHNFTHTICSDPSKGQGVLCRHEQIKVSQWLNLIRVAKQQQPHLGRLRKFFMFHATRNQGHCSRWVFSMNLTSWYSSASFLSASEKPSSEFCEYQILWGLVGSAGFLSDIYDSLDLAQVSLYCLNVEMHWVGWMGSNMRKIELRTNSPALTDMERRHIVFKCIWLKFTDSVLLGQMEITQHGDTAKNNIPPARPFTLQTFTWKLTSYHRGHHLYISPKDCADLHIENSTFHMLWLIVTYKSSYMEPFYHVLPHPSNLIPVTKCCQSYECSRYIERGALRT